MPIQTYVSLYLSYTYAAVESVKPYEVEAKRFAQAITVADPPVAVFEAATGGDTNATQSLRSSAIANRAAARVLSVVPVSRG
mgnify:CR=1 FL=1